MGNQVPATIIAGWVTRIEASLARHGINGRAINVTMSSRLKQKLLAELRAKFDRGKPTSKALGKGCQFIDRRVRG